ncbi:MAG: hypothetical protein U0175_22580 [Caldilineaceae bacterium]
MSHIGVGRPVGEELPYGVISDGGGVSAVRVRVEPPSGAPFWVNAQRTGNQWSLLLTDPATGSYTIYVEAVDKAGNVGAAGPFTLVVGGGGNLYLPLIMREQPKEQHEERFPEARDQLYLPVVSK